MEYVQLIQFSDLKEAMPYAVALSEAGIEHRISEQFTDFDPTFAGNRRMDQVKLEVRESDYERALNTISGIDQGAELTVITSPRKSGPPTALWVVITAALLLSTLYFANQLENKNDQGLPEDPLFEIRETGHSLEVSRRDDNELVSEEFDEDKNGIYEQGDLYTQSGELNSSWYDHDQDGWIDEWRVYDRLGRWASTSRDENNDGFFEVWIEHRPEGDVEYYDANGDGYFDSDEIVKDQRTE